MIQQVVRGRLEMGVTSPLGIAGLMPDIAVLNIPYLWLSDAERDHVYARLAGPLREMFEEKGLVLLAIQEAGYNGVFCTLDCANPAALKGRKVRVSPSASGRMFWSSLGTNPVQLPLSELWPGLEQGLVVAGDLPIGFYSTSPGAAVAKHFVYTDHIHSPWLYFVNKRTWERLSADKRKAIRDNVPAIFSTSKRFFSAQEDRAKAFAEKGGIVYRLTDAQRAAWASLVTPNIEPFVVGMSERAKTIYDVVKKAKTEFAAKK
jgi:TRAP-type C4-dicarboxylate transport system substrate-binding protein